MNTTVERRKLGPISLWIGVFFLIHLIGIWNPPIEAAHSWRQATGLMVARNYFEGNTSFFYPMVDETNGLSGIIGMEFPLLYYIQGKLGILFGFHVGIGRLLNVLISTLGLAYFYALVRRMATEKTAFYATLLFMISCYFMYSRKVMPDTEAIAFYLMGIYYFFKTLHSRKYRFAVFSFLFLSLGLLLKISILPLVVFVVWAYFNDTLNRKRKWVFFLPLLSLIPAFVWYFIWNPYLEHTYGNWYNLGGGLMEGARTLLGSFLPLLNHLVFHPFFSYMAFLLLVFGLYKFIKGGVPLAWKICIPLYVILFIAYAFKSGAIFLSHEYYILPIVPLLAILGGLALSKLGKYAWMGLLLISIEAIGNQLYDFKFNHGEAYKLNLSSLASTYIPNNSLVAINGNSNPQELFFLGRKGWNLSNEKMCDTQFMVRIIQKGCRFVIINKHSTECIPPYGRKLFEGKDYLLIKLK